MRHLLPLSLLLLTGATHAAVLPEPLVASLTQPRPMAADGRFEAEVDLESTVDLDRIRVSIIARDGTELDGSRVRFDGPLPAGQLVRGKLQGQVVSRDEVVGAGLLLEVRYRYPADALQEELRRGEVIPPVRSLLARRIEARRGEVVTSYRALTLR